MGGTARRPYARTDRLRQRRWAAQVRIAGGRLSDRSWVLENEPAASGGISSPVPSPRPASDGGECVALARPYASLTCDPQAPWSVDSRQLLLAELTSTDGRRHLAEFDGLFWAPAEDSFGGDPEPPVRLIRGADDIPDGTGLRRTASLLSPSLMRDTSPFRCRRVPAARQLRRLGIGSWR